VRKIGKFHHTTHARRRGGERNLSLETMESVINRHDRRTQQYVGEHGGLVYRFTRNDNERELVVVAEVKGEEAWILTGFVSDADL
jgi:hypothetical protein